MSRPRVSRTVAPIPRRSSSARKASIALGLEPSYADVGGVVGDQVDLEHPRVEHLGELPRLADASR